MSLARHALSLANGSAIIKASAKCHVQHHAIAYHAMNVAQSFCHAVINVRAFAVKNVLRNTARNAV